MRGARVDGAIALSVVPVIVGLVVLVVRLGMLSNYEALAIVLGVAISFGYALTGQFPGGTVVADALLRGVAVGLTSAGLIATIRRFALERRVSRRRGSGRAGGTTAASGSGAAGVRPSARSRRAGGATCRPVLGVGWE